MQRSFVRVNFIIPQNLSNVYDFILNDVPIWEKYTLTIEEASKYFRIGENKLRNEVVFAGVEHADGSFEFATWDYRKNALHQGHYNPDYRQAKEDFATRSGLVNAKLIFKNTELVEIYRCLEDTLNNRYELVDEQRKMLEDIQDRIQYSVVSFEELLKESMVDQCQ